MANKMKKKAGKAGGKPKIPKDLNTPFLKAVRTRFVGPNPLMPLWPAAPQRVSKTDIATIEIVDAVRAMFDRVERSVSFPEGRPNSALQLIRSAANETHWPANSQLPADWKDGKLYHLFEIACVVNIMMDAYFHSGGGGGTHQWPPTLP